MSRSQRAAGIWIVTTAAVLGCFWFVSSRADLPHRRFGGKAALAPPVYASWSPRWAWSGLLALGLVLVLAVVARRLLAGARIPPARVVLPAAVVALFIFSSATGVIRGDTDSFTRSIKPRNEAQSTADVHLVFDRDAGTFVRGYPSLIQAEPGLSIHTITHPPGALLLLAGLERAFPRHVVPRALVLMMLASLIVVPAWFIARRLAGERAALISVLLLVVVPSVVIHATTSLDGALATALVAAAALLVRGADEDGGRAAALTGGAAVGVCLFFTYAAGFLAVFGVVYAFMRRPRRDAVRVVGLCAAGGGIALLCLWVVLGFDPFASYGATASVLDRMTAAETQTRPWAYWLLGNPAAWLIMAGAPVAGLALRTTITARPPLVVAFLIPLAVAFALPQSVVGLLPGELERTLLFAYPVGTLAAAMAIDSLPEQVQGRWTAGCVLLAGMQTVAMEGLFFFAW